MGDSRWVLLSLVFRAKEPKNELTPGISNDKSAYGKGWLI
jgi:hypothetical protein